MKTESRLPQEEGGPAAEVWFCDGVGPCISTEANRFPIRCEDQENETPYIKVFTIGFRVYEFLEIPVSPFKSYSRNPLQSYLELTRIRENVGLLD